MNFDTWQTLWQKQSLPPSTTDAAAQAATLRRVRAGARAFDRTILWRDLREGLVALALGLWLAWDARSRLLAGAPSWNLWFAAVMPLGVAAFIFLDRFQTRRLRPAGAGALLTELDHALAELRHQHDLLRDVIRWYLLPLAATMALVMLPPLMRLTGEPELRVLIGLLGIGLVGALCYPIWWINHRVAIRELAPRIAALERDRSLFAAPETEAAS